jgi:hypothetical protein
MDAIRDNSRTIAGRRLVGVWPCLILPMVLMLCGCSDNPEEPVFDNPFDPDAPGSADPLNLQAVYNEGTVTLTWTGIEGHGIETYVVTRIHLDTPYELQTLEAVEGPMSYVDQEPLPNITNTYIVRALDAGGRSAAMSHVVPAEVLVPPILRLASGGTQVRSRYQDLILRSTPGTMVQVDTSLSFATAVEALVGDDETAVLTAFDLGPKTSAAARCTLYAGAVFDPGEGRAILRSGVDRLILRVVFNPTINRPDTTFTVAVPWTDLVVSEQAAGVQSMLFASSEEALAEADTLPGAPFVEDWPLLDTTLPQRVHARFISEFGFTHQTTLDLSADNLSGSAFALDLPSNRVTSNPEVSVLCRAVATEMRISQHPDFHDAPWRAYADTTEITLEGPPGPYQIFAWFRNHWFDSAILTEHVILAGAGPRVAFTHPAQDQVVRGGATIQLAGTAGTHDGNQPVSAVEVKLSVDGPWIAADGTDHWSASWSIPTVEHDTAHSLGARAILAGDDPDTATAWVNVTIGQLRVTITEPIEGSQAHWGENLTISGTAAPLLDGAALDSVVVHVLDDQLTAHPPLSAWSVDWTIPEGDQVSPVAITATVHAGFESASDEITIDLVPR